MSDALKDLKKALEHQQEGDHAVAAALLREVLKRHPDDADALHLLGLSLHADGRHDNALASIEQAIAVQPGEAMFHTNAGAVALALGRAGPAAEHHRQAIAIDPAHADAHNNLAIVLERQGDWEEAEAHLLKAIALKPDFANAHGNLGNVLRRQGRLEEAEASYHRALAIAPDLAEVHNSLGNAMRYMGRHDEAIARFERAIELNPGYAEAHANKGMALAASGYTDAAAEALEAAIAIRPDPAFRIMHAGLMPVIPASADEIARWRRRFADAFEALIAEDIRIDQGILDAPVMSFYLAYHGENDRDLMVELARFYVAASPALEWTAPHCRPGAERAPRDRLRVGVLSRYFGDHAVAWMVQGLLAELPRDAMEVVALALGQHGEAVSPTMRRAVDDVVTVPYSLDGAREAIGALEFDILIYADIGMEVFSYFLAFARLAPVQCVTWGHPDTTGIPAVDYYLSNDIAEPDYAEASKSAVFLGLIIYFTKDESFSQTDSILIVIALTGSLMVSYVRARAEGLGLRGKGGFMTRPERVAITGILLIADQPTAMLWILAIGTPLSAAHRFIDVWRGAGDEDA